MTKRKINTVPVNKILFMDILHCHGASIRRLATNPEILCSESTIRRQLSNNELRHDVLEAISKVLNVSPKCFYDGDELFDQASSVWSTSLEYNYMFLKAQQEYANALLEVQGYLFLSDVYKLLGLPLTKESIVSGWSKKMNPNSFVDFGFLEKGISNSSIVILKFNVDGVILYDFT